MKYLYKFLLLGILVIPFLNSCDKIEGSYLEENNNVPSLCEAPEFPALPSNIYKKMLIEEFTGQYCGNCPKGHQDVAKLKQDYGDTIVTYSIHASSFAEPRKEAEYVNKGMYQYDFRSPDGLAIADAMGLTSQVPSASMNRMVNTFDKSKLFSTSFWGITMKKFADSKEAAGAGIQIINDYIPGSNYICCHVKTTFLKDYSENINLVVCLVEDSIVNWQHWYNHNPEDIPDYVHRHVLRDVVNSAFGERIDAAKTKTGESQVKSYGIDLKGKDYKAEQLYIVAYLIDATTKEVLQSEEIKVME